MSNLRPDPVSSLCPVPCRRTPVFIPICSCATSPLSSHHLSDTYLYQNNILVDHTGIIINPQIPHRYISAKSNNPSCPFVTYTLQKKIPWFLKDEIKELSLYTSLRGTPFVVHNPLVIRTRSHLYTPGPRIFSITAPLQSFCDTTSYSI